MNTIKDADDDWVKYALHSHDDVGYELMTMMMM